MKISLDWLKDYIKLQQTPEEIEHLLTSSGLEVESLDETDSIKGGLRGLVVGEVLEKEKHPDADRLSVTKVNVGKAIPLQIVCGAANVAKGQKVLVALNGARLYPTFGEPFDIKNSKIRGQVSEGMICSEDEIGLGNSHEGIMVLDANAIPGTPAAEWFKIKQDHIFEIGLTPNRIDAASHGGVARDLAAVINARAKAENNNSITAQFSMPDVSAFKPESNALHIDVVVDKNTGCGRYCGVAISGVTVGESPEWLKSRLQSIGVKCINNIVDVTNFVMFETGQPLHAFDAARVKGKIIVQKTGKASTFTTLDHIERKLTGDEVMICNAIEPLCIAGVMGGTDSGVSASTTQIFLESAWFNAAEVRKAAKHHGLKTESSFRFERGTDPNGTLYALKRAALLIKEVTGGKIASAVVDQYPQVVEPQIIDINFEKINKLSGINFSNDMLLSVLECCGFSIKSSSTIGATISIPTYKTDVTRQADVVEEILRTYGYHHIPLNEKTGMSFSSHTPDRKPAMQFKISHHLSSVGFFEMINNSLVSSSHSAAVDETIKVLNPLSKELDILRPDMIASTLNTICYNINRKNHNLKLFEFGKTYLQHDGKLTETNNLVIAMTGMVNEPNWHKSEKESSLFYLKSVAEKAIELVMPRISSHLSWVQDSHTMLSSYTNIMQRQSAFGYIGSVKKNVLKQFDISQPVFIAVLNMDVLLEKSLSHKTAIKLPQPFPEVKRDLSLMLDQTINFSDLRDLALKQERKLLRQVDIFDVYEGEKIEAGKKSYALSFTLADDEATLTDKQIESVMQKIEKAFEKNLGAVIRK
jgi:phenylalanyl-tRNA synthetase beta chain